MGTTSSTQPEQGADAGISLAAPAAPALPAVPSGEPPSGSIGETGTVEVAPAAPPVAGGANVSTPPPMPPAPLLAGFSVPPPPAPPPFGSCGLEGASTTSVSRSSMLHAQRPAQANATESTDWEHEVLV